MKIEKIQKSGSKYKITLDNGKIISTYEEVILDKGLLYHKYINEKQLEKIYKDTAYYKSYNKALDMINRRLRSEYEIRKYLEKSEIKKEDIESIIDNLKRINLINDRAFAKAYTNDKINLSMDGPHKIRRHLKENKVREEYIEEAISNIDKEILKDHIKKIVDKKIKNNTKYTPYQLKQKITTYLINLGYDRVEIVSILDNYQIESPNLEKEMDKVLNRLKKKYSGDKLIYNLKNKLYTKGYTKEEIEEYIKNSSIN
ncbi:MAG: RecX family transcriptional regulator [Bacilli bacterium]|nr:RecX family transcriptional regulator [Bacilli bacterium]